MKNMDRFSDKAEKYELYRPTYTNEALLKILDLCNIVPNKEIMVADIGSGTGKFTQLLLDKGLTVYAVEPNEKMRTIAEKKFLNYNNYYSINQVAEDTKLKDNSISLITVAQAFHYFDRKKVKKEFLRILKGKDSNVALLWNFRLRDSDFIKEYENIIYNLHSSKIRPTHAQDNMTEEVFKTFFSSYEIVNLPNSQEFVFKELWGRTLSNNHMPKEDEPEYKILYDQVATLFNKYEKNGKVLFPYRTQIVVGKFESKKKEETETKKLIKL